MSISSVATNHSLYLTPKKRTVSSKQTTSPAHKSVTFSALQTPKNAASSGVTANKQAAVHDGCVCQYIDEKTSASPQRTISQRRLLPSHQHVTSLYKPATPQNIVRSIKHKVEPTKPPNTPTQRDTNNAPRNNNHHSDTIASITERLRALIESTKTQLRADIEAVNKENVDRNVKTVNRRNNDRINSLRHQLEVGEKLERQVVSQLQLTLTLVDHYTQRKPLTENPLLLDDNVDDVKDIAQAITAAAVQPTVTPPSSSSANNVRALPLNVYRLDYESESARKCREQRERDDQQRIIEELEFDDPLQVKQLPLTMNNEEHIPLEVEHPSLPIRESMQQHDGDVVQPRYTTAQRPLVRELTNADTLQVEEGEQMQVEMIQEEEGQVNAHHLSHIYATMIAPPPVPPRPHRISLSLGSPLSPPTSPTQYPHSNNITPRARRSSQPQSTLPQYSPESDRKATQYHIPPSLPESKPVAHRRPSSPSLSLSSSSVSHYQSTGLLPSFYTQQYQILNKRLSLITSERDNLQHDYELLKQTLSNTTHDYYIIIKQYQYIVDCITKKPMKIYKYHNNKIGKYAVRFIAINTDNSHVLVSYSTDITANNTRLIPIKNINNVQILENCTFFTENIKKNNHNNNNIIKLIIII